MRYKGRTIDAISFWSNYVDFPERGISADDTFLPKVVCPNPEHDTLKRHFQVNQREPKVHCFAHCGISGSWAHAICVIEGLYEKFSVDYSVCQSAWEKHPRERTSQDREQLRRYGRARKTAERIILRSSTGLRNSGKPHVQKKRSRNSGAAEAIPAVALRFETFLPQLALEYLESRGITADSIAEWELGWLPEERRIVIPAHDARGRLRFLIQRSVRPQDQPKYLYTEGFPKTSLLFGLDRIDLGMVRSDGINLVEGSLDAIIFHQYGLRNTGAILGTGISDEQVRIIARLRPKRICLCFDRDSAGIRNIEIAAKKLRKYPLYVMRYPKNKFDPAELTRKEAHGQVARAIAISQFARKVGLNFSPRKELSHVG